MNDDKRLEQFIELCKRVFERMEREDSWPWLEQDKDHPDKPTDVTNLTNTPP